MEKRRRKREKNGLGRKYMSPNKSTNDDEVGESSSHSLLLSTRFGKQPHL